METRTIKLNKGEYTDLKGVFDNHDVIILNGARGSGKSFPSAKFISEHLEKNKDSKFFYMRNRDKELATYHGWCKDLNMKALTNGAFTYKIDRGKPTRGDISLTGISEEGDVLEERVIGKCISLESSADYKSGNYSEFDIVVFEEYTTLQMNPENEKRYVFNFLENIESIFRDRPKKIILISNNFKNIPLLERAIDELTGEKFNNPIKIKIFRKGNKSKTNAFLEYINGEIYNDDEFKVIRDQFKPLYSDKDYVINRHYVYPRKYFVEPNNRKFKMYYREDDYLMLKMFCQGASNNEFYYKDRATEKRFILDYTKVLNRCVEVLCGRGLKYID